MMNEPVFLSLHDVTCQVRADYPPFLKTLQALASGMFAERAEGRPQVDISLAWNAALERDSAAMGLGRGVERRGQWVVQRSPAFLPGFEIETAWEGECLQVRAAYRPAGPVSWAAQRLGRSQEKLLSGLVYAAVLFPLLYALERRGLHPLHAAAVRQAQGVALLAGLAGSGKTTVSLGLLAEPEAGLLSDNLVLFDRQRVYPFPEPLHLSPESMALLPQAARRRLESYGAAFSYGREVYRYVGALEAPGAPRAVFLLSQSEPGQATQCRQMEPSEGWAWLEAADRLARERQAYEAFAAAADLDGSSPHRSLGRALTLQALLGDAPMVALNVEKGAELEGARRLVMKKMLLQAAVAQEGPVHVR